MRELCHLYVNLATGVDPSVNARVHGVARSLVTSGPPGITDVIPGYTSLLVEYDARLLARAHVEKLVTEALTSAGTSPAGGSLVEIGVVYDGPDLGAVAAAAGLSEGEVVRRHAAVTYHAYAAGFAPGFVYLGEVDPAIRRPRLLKPRAAVPAGSVGIADGQTGVYPLDSPGGWNLLGHAVAALYDPRRPRPALIHAGDRVRFVPLQDGPSAAAVRPLDLLPPEPKLPVLKVRRAGLLDLVVDAGRFRAGHLGFTRGGPADPVSAQIAGGLVANSPDDPVLEMNVLGPTVEVVGECVIAFAGHGVRLHIDGQPAPPYVSTFVRAGQVLSFPPAPLGRRGYLAVAGGIESATFMGSASVDTRGLIGRPLRAGDVLGRGRLQTLRQGFSFIPHFRASPVVRLRLLPGPQFEPELLAELTARPLRIEHSDRMGVRLETTAARGGGVLSEGNPLGAVQLTAGGEPLILLNDRGTMGGYTKPAVVHPRDLPLLAQARDGTYVQLVAGTR